MTTLKESNNSLNQYITVRDITDYLSAEFEGPENLQIVSLNTFSQCFHSGSLSFFDSDCSTGPKYLNEFKVNAIITQPCNFKYTEAAVKIASLCPRLDFVRIYHQFFKPPFQPFISGSATIESQLPSQIYVGANVYIGRNVAIGEGSILEPNSVIFPGTIIGKNVTIGANSTLGNNGFGFIFDPKTCHNLSFPHLSNLFIGDNVYIGCNSNINKGALTPTRIGNDVLIDDQVHIAHNSVIEEFVVIAGKTAIAGSVLIGKKCTIGGMVGIADHIKIAPHTTIMSSSMVTKNIMSAGIYSGNPAISHIENLRNTVRKRGK